MKENIKTGVSYASTCTVSQANTAQTVGSGDLPVFATPAMIALMENAAMNAVGPFLEEGETTVGSYIESTHEHPTHLGDTVTATATLTAIEGRKLTFSVEAADKKGRIGKGSHIRYVVKTERFMQ